MSKRRKLIWQLYPSYLVIIVLSIAAMTWYATRVIENYQIKQTAAGLKARALVVQELIKGRISLDNAAKMDALAKEMGLKTDARVTIIMPSGTVLGDSDEDPSRMDDHSIRPEVKAALGGKVGVARRYSFTLNREMMYVAAPVSENGRIVGIVRVARSLDEMGAALSSIYRNMALATLIIIVMAAVMGFYVAHRINKPIAELKAGADSFARGDLHYRLQVPNTEEIGGLAEAMNSMAAQLDERIRTVTSQRNELEAVLSGMVEAVIVVDAEERILRTNRAARELFGVSDARIGGQKVSQAVRNTQLNNFIQRTLGDSSHVQEEIVVLGARDRYLQATGSSLSDNAGGRIGALVVLNDITRLKKLENIRRDFVANVSHELKTPITSIQGFLETLKEGAINDAENAGRFLDIIIRHTERLSSIIEDLLSLSRIEQQSERGGVELQSASIGPVMRSVHKDCVRKAAEKDIHLDCACDEDILARINPSLLEQALVNLVDNALKYSEPGKTVWVTCERSDDALDIIVRDEGCGISGEHLDRIFERFYRVDKARSRKEGGTGLGLAIVKHIVNAHGGRISVESAPGSGSTFTIHLPG